MEVILSTAFGVKAETQTVENDPITELAKKAMAPHPLIGIMCRDLIALLKKLQCLFLSIVIEILRSKPHIIFESTAVKKRFSLQ